jgi:hypothetical protein
VIRTEKGELIAECSECGEEHYGGTLEFRDFIDELKDLGWKIKKDGDEWTHICEGCSNA